MGFIIIGWLTTSTLPTLLVAPAAYMLPDSLSALRARVWRRGGAATTIPIVAAAAPTADEPGSPRNAA